MELAVPLDAVHGRSACYPTYAGPSVRKGIQHASPRLKFTHSNKTFLNREWLVERASDLCVRFACIDVHIFRDAKA